MGGYLCASSMHFRVLTPSPLLSIVTERMVPGLDWSNVQTSTNFAYGTQVDTGVYLTNDSAAIVSGAWGLNQTVQATAHLPNFSGGEVELRLRTSLSAHKATGYEILWGGGGYC